MDHKSYYTSSWGGPECPDFMRTHSIGDISTNQNVSLQVALEEMSGDQQQSNYDSVSGETLNIYQKMSLHIYIESDLHIDAEIFQFGLKQWTRHTENLTKLPVTSKICCSLHLTAHSSKGKRSRIIPLEETSLGQNQLKRKQFVFPLMFPVLLILHWRCVERK